MQRKQAVGQQGSRKLSAVIAPEDWNVLGAEVIESQGRFEAIGVY
jgi:hypothetical protein